MGKPGKALSLSPNMGPAPPAARPDTPEAPVGSSYCKADEPHITWFAAISTYFGYAVLIMFGHIRDFFGRWVTQRNLYDTFWASLARKDPSWTLS
jgi:hypothetical protein